MRSPLLSACSDYSLLFALGLELRLDALGQGLAQLAHDLGSGHKEVDQLRRYLDQNLTRHGHELAQPAGILLGDAPPGQFGFNVPGEQTEHLSEGQVGVPDARVGVTLANGDDQVTVGPTVQKTVWIDAGPGDDRVEILEGNAILVDKAEGGIRNDSLNTAYGISLPSEPGEPKSVSFEGLTMDSPEDADWFVFELPREPVGDARLVLTSLSKNDNLTLRLTDGDGNTLRQAESGTLGSDAADAFDQNNDSRRNPHRSEERRVGKECRSRWSQYH